MACFYQKIFQNQGTRKVLSHIFDGRRGLANCGISGLSTGMMRIPPAKCNYFKNSKFHTWSYCPHNRHCQGLDVKYYKRSNTNDHVETPRWKCLSEKHTLMVPVLMGSATIGGSSKDPHSNCSQISDWVQTIRNYLKNSVTLYASASDDIPDIPDINALAKDISQHGLQKIEEAQKVLQQKLKKIRADVPKAANDVEKEVLKLAIAAIEEAIRELEEAKRNIKKELKKAKKRK